MMRNSQARLPKSFLAFPGGQGRECLLRPRGCCCSLKIKNQNKGKRGTMKRPHLLSFRQESQFSSHQGRKLAAAVNAQEPRAPPGPGRPGRSPLLRGGPQMRIPCRGAAVPLRAAETVVGECTGDGPAGVTAGGGRAHVRPRSFLGTTWKPLEDPVEAGLCSLVPPAPRASLNTPNQRQKAGARRAIWKRNPRTRLCQGSQ